MLHPLDDLPVHQTPEPLLHPATASPDAYDRFFANGFSPTGDLFLGLALGVYPNRRVIDGTFSVVRDGVQHNVRASGRAPADRTTTTVGPISVVVEEPMRRHRISVDDRFGLSAELTLTMISAVIEEPRFQRTVEGRRLFDYTRLTQFGRWEGWIDLDGQRIELAPGDGVVGVRDRSWGVRPVGDRLAGPASIPQFFWIWAPTVFDDVCTHLALNHEADGRPWHQSGAVVRRLDGGPSAGADPLDPSLVHRGEEASVEIRWQPGTRWAGEVATTLTRWEAEPVVVRYEPLLRFQMSGIGYTHPTWGHGRWLGEAEAARDAIELAGVDPADPTMIHVQTLCRAHWGDRTGLGVVEQLAIGDHTPSGLTGPIAGHEP